MFPCDQELDATGLWCPEPIMLLHGKMREMTVGQTLKLMATDPATRRDLTKFCTFRGHDLLYDEENKGVYCFVVRKAS